MRIALLGMATVCALVTTVQPGTAQESFFNSRYCAQGGRGSGLMDCSYNTMAQCRASASGLGRYCVENPNWRSSRHRR
jgi:hypothetical protein